MTHDFVRKVDAVHVDIRHFLLSPTHWRSSKVKTPLDWTYLQFTEANRQHIPKQPGIYAFIVRHINDHFPGHGFIMYIGITGANANGRTLHKRYGDYLMEKTKNKRKNIHYMLNKYPDDIYFAYSVVTDQNVDLEALELDINDAIMPPVVVQDFTAEIRKIAGVKI